MEGTEGFGMKNDRAESKFERRNWSNVATKKDWTITDMSFVLKLQQQIGLRLASERRILEMSNPLESHRAPG